MFLFCLNVLDFVYFVLFILIFFRASLYLFSFASYYPESIYQGKFLVHEKPTVLGNKGDSDQLRENILGE